MKEKEELYQFLASFLTPNRATLFDKVLEERSRHIVVAVEDLHKEQNASAVVRTCDCFGIQELHVIEENNPYQVSNHIAKGAEKWLDISTYHEEENNSHACLKTLRERGYAIVATSPGVNQYSPTDLPLEKPIALFFGGERDGLSQELLENADMQLCIPMVVFTDSFNISVSAAITLYELTNRLKASNIEWKLSEEDKLDLRIKWATHTVPHGDKLVEKFHKDRH